MKANLLTIAALAVTAHAQVHRVPHHRHAHLKKDEPVAAPSYSGGSSSDGGSGGSGSGASGLGIAYSPYRADGTCKDSSEVKSDFEKINGYGMVRLYGTDCHQTANVLAAAKPKNMKIMAGIFDINNVADEAQCIIEAAKNDWDSIHTVSVGNELVNQGTPAGTVVAAIGTARDVLQGAGYNGNVVTVDTFVAMIANPSICEASDYAAANCHAFFDGGRTAEQAGPFVKEQAERVKNACGGKKTVITESGWPWKGESNGVAVADKQNQGVAIQSLKDNFSKNLVLFTAFDDLWKKDSGDTYGCEKYYGIL
ncbi:glycoside hydrolase family 17 [Lecanosticta acicola]|uniref:Glycoside hydrolase family 17 n=1 Tax=Lecanosticta acicola TaxID=111012 RepID=A0AAI8Z738_9PEZI|nr:glycoside hydrolase family 17 [Lecanosticta acicola]